VRILEAIEPSRSGVYALYQDGASVDLARRAVEALIEHTRKSGD
jgi:hypothetical protein